MLNVFLLMCAVATGLAVIAYMRDPQILLAGVKDGGKMLLGVLPIIVPAFIAGGLLPKVLPQEIMLRWMGEESGLRGLMLGTMAGAVTPGGPFVAFPLVAGLLKGGAGVAPLMAFITSWSVLAVNRLLVFEGPILGWKLSLTRFGASLLVPIFVGLLTKFIYSRL